MNEAVDGPGGAKLRVGDVWPSSVPPGVMTADVLAYEGRLAVLLAVRFDDFDDREWQAFGAIPAVVCFTATSTLGWFLTESSGLHLRTAFNMDSGDQFVAAVRRAIRDESSKRSLTLFGVDGDTIRSIQVGISLRRIWTLLDEALAALEATPKQRALSEILAEQADVSASGMFADAMEHHLRVDPR